MNVIVLPAPTRRELFLRGALEQLGNVVVWGALDCSELVALGELAAGLPDRRATHTAQRYLDENWEPVVAPTPGDLGFFGRDPGHVIHVVIASPDGHVLSADGATSTVTTYEEAEKHPAARVRLHPDVSWYRSAPFLGWRVHRELDEPTPAEVAAKACLPHP